VAGVVGLSAAACSGTIPHHGTSALLTTPSPSTVAEGAGLAGATSAALGRDGVSFTLVNGTFMLTSEDGELTGTYGGVVTAPIRLPAPRARSWVTVEEPFLSMAVSCSR
jgi:hypothetical protein